MITTKPDSVQKGSWVRDATGALEYLKLGPSERIDYRVNKGITLLEWYKQFRPNVIDEPTVSRTDLQLNLGLGRQAYQRLLDSSTLVKVQTPIREGRNEQIESRGVNKILEAHSQLVKLSELMRLILVGDFYMHSTLFNREFGSYTIRSSINTNLAYVTLLDAARIIHLASSRKYLIEQGKSLSDLNDESGWNLPKKLMHLRYCKMITRGELKVEFIGNFAPDGTLRRGKRYVIPPQEYAKVLDSERENLELRKSGYGTAYVAKKLGLTRNYVSTLFRSGQEAGVIHPVAVKFVPDGIASKWIIQPHEAEKLISREIVVPNREMVRRLKSSLSADSVQEMLALFSTVRTRGDVVDVNWVAKQMGVGPKYATSLISVGSALGHIAPVLHLFNNKGRIYKYFIPLEHANWLIANRTSLPSYGSIAGLNALSRPDAGDTLNDSEIKLFRAVKEGDVDQFGKLFEIFKPMLLELAENLIFSPGASTYQERLDFLTTSLFNLTQSPILPRKVKTLKRFLRNELKQRIREEKPTPLRLGRPISANEDDSLVTINSATLEEIRDAINNLAFRTEH